MSAVRTTCAYLCLTVLVLSAAMFAMTDPQGDHGFSEPGSMIDDVREDCVEACPEPDTCDCDGLITFDVGLYLVNMLGSYLASEGQLISTDRCMADDSCPGYPPVLDARTGADLP